MANEKAPASKEQGRSERRDVERKPPLAALRDEIDDLFDEFTSGWPLLGRSRTLQPSSARRSGWLGQVPAFDVVDKDKEIQIRADLPGMDERDIDVRLSDGALTITGEKKEEREEGEEDGTYYLSERRYGSFQRSIPLPEGIDRDNVDASFRKGVLTIRLPKTDEAREKAKRIEVKGEK